MDEYERTDAALRDQPRAHDRLAECGGGRQHAGVVGENRLRRDQLLTSQFPLKSRIQRSTGVAFIANSRTNSKILKRVSQLVEAASWKTNVTGVVLGAGDDAWLVVRRQPHRLRLVELRVLEGRQTEQAVAQPGMEPVFGYVDLVADDQLQRRREVAGDWGLPPVMGRWHGPRFVFTVFLRRQPNAKNPTATFGLLNEVFDL